MSRTERRRVEKAVETAVKRHGETSPKLRGPDNRVPVSLKRGYVTDDRFFANVDELRSTSVFVKSAVQNPGADSGGGDVLFTILLQSLGQLNKAHAELLLSWLEEHPLLVLDPGLRWIVSGILARLIKYEVGTDGCVKLEFAYRNVRVSGRNWAHVRESAVADSFMEQKLEATIQGAVDELSKPEFLRANDKTGYVAKMFTDDNFPAQVEMSFEKVLSKKAILRKEERLAHQKTISLKFVRKIDSLCAGYGDPIVIVGAAGGNGGGGRAQANHQILLDTLAGFYSVILLDEFCSTKKTPCCHRDAYAPRLGRSRGCKHCAPVDRGKPTVWWDRDAGASW
jgi:hypothetical protein